MAKTKVSNKIAGEAGGANSKLTPVTAHFWKHKTLEELNSTEWESLCDGCGRCCLVKLEDEDSGVVHFTDIACKLFDSLSCRCMDYARRLRKVRDCIRLTPAKVRALRWLPPSCAYRLVNVISQGGTRLFQDQKQVSTRHAFQCAGELP